MATYAYHRNCFLFTSENVLAYHSSGKLTTQNRYDNELKKNVVRSVEDHLQEIF
jgi:hypothetical protein